MTGPHTDVTVTVRRRPDISDPQGATVSRALRDLGYEVEDVRIDKIITLRVSGTPNDLNEQVAAMCEQLLANPVMEDYEIRIDE
ncbi:MAG: phosphoribosylformylglycinamidine synthase subunit PurS [Acidimicrobiia bacterium]|nr:phosphoribosylformylglycinamidine synthase subunit PurS [Acidimicrobiia bacterium]